MKYKGFAYLSEIRALKFLPQFKNARELYMMAIAPDYQKLGYGKRMLEQWLQRLNRFDTLLARTYEVSVAMRKLLTHNGFHDFGPRNKGPRILIKSKTATIG